MKKLFVLLLAILICIVVLLIIRLDREQVRVSPRASTPIDTRPIDITTPLLPAPIVTTPQEPKGVLPKEQRVLDWLKANDCDVNIPVRHALLDEIYEKEDIPHDKYYEISWNVEFVNVKAAMKAGDPTPPRPNSYARFSRFYSWDSARNSYDDLVKIKQDFQKDIAGGFVIK